MQICVAQDDNEPQILQCIDEEWKFLEEIWSHIPIKYYIMQVGCSSITNRRLLYINPTKEGISYLIKTNMPQIVAIKNCSLILSKDEAMYIKFTITAPSTQCKLSIKFVVYDVIQNLPVEGIEMVLNIKAN